MAFAQGGTPAPNIPGLSSDQAAMLSQLVGQQAAQAGASNYPGLVYLGSKKPGPHGGSGMVAPDGGNYDNWVTGEQAEHAYNDWSAKRRQDFVAQAKIAGLIDIDGGEVEGAKIWRELVKEASYFGIGKKQKVSPWDILTGYVKAKGGGGAVWQKDPSNPNFEVNRLTGERRYVGPRFRTTTQQSVNFSDPATAAAVATKVFQDLMGRDPGKGELGAFADALHQAEAGSPVVTSTTTEYDPVTGEPVSSSSTSSGGVDEAGKGYLAQQRVKGTKEYGVVQATTNYQNVLENLVWNSPSLGGG
jgi:hypothetical protein